MSNETKNTTPETADETKKKNAGKKNEDVNEQGEKLVSIRIPLTRENQEDVFVRVNHRTWLIKRGETVKVPECVVEVLNNSERAILEGIEYQSKVSHE